MEQKIIMMTKDEVAQCTNIDVLRAAYNALASEDRHIRRILCIRSAEGSPYMDDGEASDQQIDYLRDSAHNIERKLIQRSYDKLQHQLDNPVWRYSSFPPIGVPVLCIMGNKHGIPRILERRLDGPNTDESIEPCAYWDDLYNDGQLIYDDNVEKWTMIPDDDVLPQFLKARK